MSNLGELPGVRGAESMDSLRERSGFGGGGLVTYLEVTLARINVLAHLRPQEKPRTCGLRIKEQDGDSSRKDAEVPPTHSRDPSPPSP